MNAKEPFNAEPPSAVLAASYITPVEHFYVRNHGPVPVLDEKTYSFSVFGLVDKPRHFTMADLSKLPKKTIVATMQCAGNRRTELSYTKPVKGVGWDCRVIGNAEWSGVLLRDVLELVGIQKREDVHVEFMGLDTYPGIGPFGASIPVEKAMDPVGDVLLAWEMNGKPLTPDHGYPLRIVVPGVVGARSVKWLGYIRVQPHESTNFYVAKDYRSFPPDQDWDKIDFAKASSIQDMPIQAAILSPEPNTQPKDEGDGTFVARGYAWSGGGRYVERVDLTLDGKTWHVATLAHAGKRVPGRTWTWVLWEARIPKPKGAAVLAVRAWDSAYNVMPESTDLLWNVRGVLNNSWHRVKLAAPGKL